VLWNLLSNALKFSNVGGKVELRTSVVADAELHVRLTDDGCGIDPHWLERIFQPFEQGEISVSPRFGGLGLGLAISKFIVDAHEGEIWAESPGLGKGASFTVSLPLAETEQVQSPPPLGPKLPPVRRRVRILLVDNHMDTLDVMSRLLTHSGHEVVAASTYKKALRVGQQEEFDLLISDLGLHDGSGYELMSALRGISSLKGIALSGYGMKADVASVPGSGILGALDKAL
jgi:CheY-like chemotaxis protein